MYHALLTCSCWLWCSTSARSTVAATSHHKNGVCQCHYIFIVWFILWSALITMISKMSESVLSVCLSVCQSVCLSICLSVCLSVCLFVFNTVSLERECASMVVLLWLFHYLSSLIVSQWTSFLDIMQYHLDRAGIAHARIDGKWVTLASSSFALPQNLGYWRWNTSVHEPLPSLFL